MADYSAQWLMYKQLWKSWWLGLLVGSLLGAVIGLLGGAYIPQHPARFPVLIPAFLAVVVFFVWYSRINFRIAFWRCPRCGQKFGDWWELTHAKSCDRGESNAGQTAADAPHKTRIIRLGPAMGT